MKVQNYSSKFIFYISVLAVGIFSLGFFTLSVNAEHGEDGIEKDLLEGSNIVNFRDSTNVMLQSSTLSVDTSTVKAGFITITVEEKDANLDATNIDIINANATSTSVPEGIDVTLTETGVDTAIFVGRADVGPNGSPSVLQIRNGDEIIVLYNPEPDGVPRVSAKIEAEAGPGSVRISDIIIDTPTEGDRLCPRNIVVHPINMQLILSSATKTTVTISYANALLEPLNDVKNLKMYYRPDNSFTYEKLPDLILNHTAKTVTASKDKFTLSPTLSGEYAIGFDAGCPGGGGGGLVRPGLVVNALAGAGSLAAFFGGGEGNGPSNPTFSEGTVSIFGSGEDGFAGTIATDDNPTATTNVARIGEKVSVRVPLYENQGINNINKVIWYLNFAAENYDRTKIDTYIEFNRGVVTVVDPHEKLEYANIEILQESAWDLIVLGELIPKNTMTPSHFAFYSEDLDRNSGQLLIPNALEVIEQSILLADEQNEITTQPLTHDLTQVQLTEIPLWVKSNAQWWKQQQIDDSDFIAGIEYLIHKAIIEIDENKNSNIVSQDIPYWIQDVAGYWANDSITDDEFILAMQWLINNGILKVQT